MARQYLFISGANRSGTTWLGEMIDHHPEVRVLGEAAMFRAVSGVGAALAGDELRTWAHGFTTRRFLQVRGVSEAHLESGMRRAMIERAMEALWRPGERVRVLGDRTPYHTCVCAREIAGLFPDAVFVHVLRDGRDCAVSAAFKHLAQGKSEGLFGGAAAHARRRAEFVDRERDSGGRLMTDAFVTWQARRWRESVEGARGAQGLFGERFVELRYEDLVVDPAPGLERVFDALRVDRGASVARAAAAERAFGRATGRERGDADPRDLRRSGTPGDWVRWFTARDATLFGSEAGRALGACGYRAPVRAAA